MDPENLNNYDKYKIIWLSFNKRSFKSVAVKLCPPIPITKP